MVGLVIYEVAVVKYEETVVYVLTEYSVVRIVSVRVLVNGMDVVVTKVVVAQETTVVGILVVDVAVCVIVDRLVVVRVEYEVIVVESCTVVKTGIRVV